MASRRNVILGVCSAPFASGTLVGQSESDKTQERAAAEAREGRDRELFLEAAVNIAAGKQVRARLSLRTILNVYPESPLIPQVRLLLFYSTVQSYPDLHNGAGALECVEAYLKNLEASRAAPGA